MPWISSFERPLITLWYSTSVLFTTKVTPPLHTCKTYINICTTLCVTWSQRSSSVAEMYAHTNAVGCGPLWRDQSLPWCVISQLTRQMSGEESTNNRDKFYLSFPPSPPPLGKASLYLQFAGILLSSCLSVSLTVVFNVTDCSKWKLESWIYSS